MALRVSGKNLDVGEALRQRVSDRIADALSKYFEGGWSGHVTLAREGSGYRADCALHLDSGTILQSHADGTDAYSSADTAVERIEKRLRRYKRRIKDRTGVTAVGVVPEGIMAPSYILATPDHEDDADVDGWSPTVVAEATTSLKRFSVSDAVLELDLSGAPVLVFLHAGHGRVNIVYRRTDGHVGWVDPPAFSSESTH